MFRVAFNSIVATTFSILSRLTHLVNGVVLADWKHSPNYYITLDTYISYDQIYAYDVQPNVKIYQDDKGSVVGYIGADTYINVDDWVAHITLEGTIIIWGPTDDARGRLCVVSPLNTVINNLAVNGQSVEVIVVPPSAVAFTETNVRWNQSDYPNTWMVPNPPVSIQLHYDSGDIPYVTTHYFVQNVSRYDHPTYNCKYVQNGTDIGVFNSVSTIVSSSTLRMQTDKACWLLSILKNKYTFDYNETAFDLFRKRSYIQ